jgi:hypothetical protein
VTDYASEEHETGRLAIRAAWTVALALIGAILAYNLLAEPLRELVRHAVRRHPAIQALADAEDAIQRAIDAHNARPASLWHGDHDRMIDADLHRRLGEVVELQKAVAAKLATLPERTPERQP